MTDFFCEYCSCESTGHSIQYGICRGSPFCHECKTKMVWEDTQFVCECNNNDGLPTGVIVTVDYDEDYQTYTVIAHDIDRDAYCTMTIGVGYKPLEGGDKELLQLLNDVYISNLEIPKPTKGQDQL